MTWELFVKMFHVDVPLWLVMALLLICTIASVAIARFLTTDRRNGIAGIWTACYIFIILWITVLGRLNHASNEYRFNLMPLWSIDNIRDGYVETIYEKVDNMILFIPLGFCLGLLKTQWWKVIGFGIATSIAIELLQLITRTGMCETDDVICNTYGCILGLVFVRALLHIFNKLRIHAEITNIRQATD